MPTRVAVLCRLLGQGPLMGDTTTPMGDLVAALGALADPRKDGRVEAGSRRYRYLELPDLLLAHIEDIHTLPKRERHHKERPLLEAIARQVLEKAKPASEALEITITWSDTGRTTRS